MDPQTSRSGSYVRFLLPSPVSADRGLWVLLLGFAVEGVTELFQFLDRGNLAQGPVEYETTLATTILGFYLMFLGLREWHTFNPMPQRVKPFPADSRFPRFGLGLWAGGTLATGALSLALGGAGSAPIWVAWPVGGLVVWAFGNFFFGLRAEAQRLGSNSGRVAGWVAFAWSLVVATLAGRVVGDRAIMLLTEFVTSWVALVASFAPIVVAMSPLFVTYSLLIGAFWPARRKLQETRR